MSNVSLLSAQSFVNAIGVNTHVAYTDGKYDDYHKIIADLAYLGINHVRDAIPNITLGGYGYLHYAPVAAAGIKFDFVTTGSDTNLPVTMARLDAFEQANPGAISAIEGPNEVNNWPVTFGGLSGNAAAIAFQSALNSAVHHDPSLSGLAVYNLTSWPTLVGPSDAFNIHLYPWAGSQPAASIADALAEGRAVMPSFPAVITESGYSSAGQGSDVDQLTQAKLELNLIFDAEKAGVGQVYLYELMEAYADPSGTDHEQHFGLFNYNGTAKPVATALHNLTSILADTGAGASNFVPTPLSYSITGLPTSGNSLLIEKSSGVYDLAVWAEPTIWNGTTHQEVAAPTNHATISFGSAHDVLVFDPLAGTAPILAASNVTSFVFNVVDHPVILEIREHVAEVSSTSPATSTAGGVSTSQRNVVSDAGGPDFSGHGSSDALWRNTDGHVSIWTSVGSNFTSSEVGAISTDWHTVSTGDYSGDGKADILWRNDNGTVSLWTSTGPNFQSATLGTISGDWHAEASFDFSGNGRGDVLWRNDSGAVSLWLSTAAGFRSQDIGQVSSDWHVVGSGDVDGDGKSDVVWRNDSGEVSIWKSTGTGFQSADIGKVSADWHVAGVGDFTGDGKSDLLWQNDNGAISLWTSTGSGFQSHTIGMLSNDWHVQAASDVNGDGKADLLLRNDNGAVSEWLATGSNFVSHDVGQVSLDWHLLA